MSRAGTPFHATWGLSLTEISGCLWCIPSLGISGPNTCFTIPRGCLCTMPTMWNCPSLCVISVETIYSPKGFLCMPGFIEHLVRTKKGQCRYSQVGHDPALSHPQSGQRGCLTSRVLASSHLPFALPSPAVLSLISTSNSPSYCGGMKMRPGFSGVPSPARSVGSVSPLRFRVDTDGLTPQSRADRAPCQFQAWPLRGWALSTFVFRSPKHHGLDY